MARVLLIDDDKSLREVVGFILAEDGHEVLLAEDGNTGVERFDSDLPDLVLTDMRLPGRDGMEILRHIRAHPAGTDVPVIVLTAYGTVGQAVEAMKMGAFSYLLKPFNRDELRLTLGQALRAQALEADNRRLRRLLREKIAASPLIYASDVMARLAAQVQQVSPSEAAVLITGESGTGKELIARALHDWSPRWDRPFVAVNCGAIPADLVESELFGHARGAFTGAGAAAVGRIRSAEGGTLFLDEVGELPLRLQPKLLRVLETKRVDPVGGPQPVDVDFRLVCATNKDLPAEVREGRFREDLYYRVEVVRLHVPTLRERPEDIPLLWEHFTRQHGPASVRSTPELLRRLEQRFWRGNVRELINLNQRLVLLRQEDLLTEEDLQRNAEPSAGESTRDEDVGQVLGEFPSAGLSLPDLEKEVIRRALALHGGNKSRTARYLGIPRHVLVYRLAKYGL